ncbi:MAG: bifunctional [glutamate--ammonia ligase]-adenylyl-L-tyrosine phosphorylase/[glutamate--ammonia-ligase] adenylyltransferase [Planctomycetota bacterium]
MEPSATTRIFAARETLNDVTDADWTLLGFSDALRVRRVFADLRERPECVGFSVAQFKTVANALASSSDPMQALSVFESWIDVDGPAMTPSWSEPQFLKALFALFASTPALSSYFIRFPARTQPALQTVLSRDLPGGKAWEWQLIERMKFASNHAERLATLRRMRVEFMLQIATLDLLLVSPLNSTVRALSELADACVGAALRIAEENIRPRLGWLPAPHLQASGGAPVQTIPFAVFALGKLGGEELNYSSDIDLVFMHRAEGETQGGARSVSAEAYVTALAEELISALDKVTEDGRVYRVDVRLRPHGTAGALVRGFEQTMNYFQDEGRTWERQAWLKARAIAGDVKLGNDMLDQMQTFVFRRFLSNDAILDIKALKRQIEKGVAKRGESEDEVKLGRGGIRDVEFTVQFMQLLYGSEHPGVRTGNTLRALYLLRREGLILDAESAPLNNAYVFLRHVEHRLQLYGDMQTHLLPSDSVSRRRIALSMGYSDSYSQTTLPPRLVTAQDAFEAERMKNTTKTREVFERLFANLFSDKPGVDGELSDELLAPDPDLSRIASLLPRYGFTASDSCARDLLDLTRERLVLTSPSRTRKMFAALAPKLLTALAATGEPEQSLGRFAGIAGSLGAKALFFLTLNENPWLLKMTAELSAWSEFLTGILVANPGLFDELVDSLRTGQRKTEDDMNAELKRLVSGGDIADTLRAYRAGELLRIGVSDLIHSVDLARTQEELSDLAATILNAQLKHCLKELKQRRGELLNAQGKPVGFAVLALGKFGGREMNFGSDLDVIYFYNEDGSTADGLPAVSYFAELAQALTRSMAHATNLGPLYELDARLRPNGNKGPLALSLDDFKRYADAEQLMDWERLALTRIRFVAGDTGVGERAMHMIRSAIYSPLKCVTELATELLSMRERLEESAEPGNIKRGRGGVMDIEFVAQYLQLVHGPSKPKLRQPSTVQALNALMTAKKLSIKDGEALRDAYHFLRTLENRLRIVHGLSSNSLPKSAEALRKLALRTGYADENGVRAEDRLLDLFKHHTTTTRAIFLKIVQAGANEKV